MRRESLWDPERGYNGERVEGLDFYVEHLSWKKLPKEIFEPFGGYEAARALRKERGFRSNPPPPASAASVATDAVDGAAGSASDQTKKEGTVEKPAARKPPVLVEEPKSATSAEPVKVDTRFPEIVIDSHCSELTSLASLKRKIQDATVAVIAESLSRNVRWQRGTDRTSVKVYDLTFPDQLSVPSLFWNLTDK